MVEKRNRMHSRYQISLPVRVEAGELGGDGAFINLSLGGALLRTDLALAFGQEIKLTFRVPAVDADTEVQATVRWTQEGSYGVQFGSLRARDVWGLNQLFRDHTAA